MYKLSKLIFLLCFGTQLFAQTTSTETPSIVFKGKITYERKTNVHKQLDEMMKGRAGADNSMAENFKKQIPKYKTDIFELFFTDKQSLYKPAPNGIMESKMMMGAMPAEANTVFTNFESQQSSAEKKVFEKNYLIQDSLKKYNWKITEEFRKIAGFNCRRAETIMMDSVYVISFYTDAILANGGPEGFNGLPGMILGVVLPRLNVTYFATKFDNYLPDEKILVSPTKGEKTNFKSLEAKLKESMSQWGDFMQRMLWYVNI